MDVAKLYESRLSAMKAARSQLIEQWNPYLAAIDSYHTKKGLPLLNEWDKQNVATCLENALIEGALKTGNKLFEATTYQSDISFLGVQLPVIAALLPSLVLNKISIVQALDRRTGSVFYLDVKYDQAKGAVQANQTMIGAKTGKDSRQAGRLYGSTRVYHETFATGDGATNPWGPTVVTYFPLVSGSITATDGVEIFTDNADGTLTGDNGGTGVYVPATGSVTLTFGVAVAKGVIVYIDYRYNYEKAANSIPGVNITLTGETVTAEDFPLRADYTLGAAIDLQKAHGLSLEDEIVKYLGGEIKFEIDHLGIDQMYSAAVDPVNGAGTAPDFDASLNIGQEWLWRKYMFLDSIEAGSNLIFAKTLRGFASFIVCGNNVARVIRQLAPHFVPAKDLGTAIPTGPYELGTLDGRLVIQDPFLDTDSYFLGFKGDNYLFAGFIYAPYIPLMTTPTILLANLKAQKGFLSSAGFKTINSGMYANGTIIGLPV
jgi:hypothetical protein